MPGGTGATKSTNASSTRNEPLVYRLVSEPSFGEVTFSSEANTFTYFTTQKSSANDSFTYKARDGVSESSVARVDISIVGDPLFEFQWHLDNTGQANFAETGGLAGNDLNLENALKNKGLTGRGITVAVVDEDLDIGHEDLSANVVINESYDFINGDTDPTRTLDDGGHGTSVAGIIAARAWNNTGGRGIAPEASLKGFNFLEDQTLANYISAFGGERFSQDVDIFNYSAAMQPQKSFSVLPAIQQMVITETLPAMRDGKGAIFVKSAGGSFGPSHVDCGLPQELRLSCIDSVTDNHHIYQQVIVVASLRADGTKSRYSSVGATTWISGLGGEDGNHSPAIMTTDQSGCDKGYVRAGNVFANTFDNAANPPLENSGCNYTSSFKATSAAAPSVVGGIALVLEERPDLSYRDVKGILAASAQKIDTEFEPVVVDGITYYDWVDNAAGYSHHNGYGFGRFDVDRAVALATDYDSTALGPQTISVWEDNVSEEVITVPAGNEATSSITTTVKGTLEFVRVRLDLSAPGIKEMGVRLTSPSGTTVTLFQPKTHVDTDPAGVIYLATSALYGESTDGTWTLRLFDHEDDGLGITLNKWAIKFFYH